MSVEFTIQQAFTSSHKALAGYPAWVCFSGVTAKVAATQKVPKPLKPEQAADIVRDYAFWQMNAPVAEDLLEAIEIQTRHKTSFWDAMILWSAGQLGCSTLWSEDLNDGQAYDGVRVVNPLRKDYPWCAARASTG